MLFKTVAATALAAASLAVSAVAAPAKGKYFDKFIFVILENNDYPDVMKDPYFASLAARGLLMTNYHGTVHPSQPNYWSTVGQSTYRDLIDPATNTIINGDNGDDSFNITGRTNIADSLENAGYTWKIYSENYPGNCFTGHGAGDELFPNGTVKTPNRLYQRKHNPFISYMQIQTNATRCKNLVSETEWAADLTAGTLPDYSYYVPNQMNDAHDSTIAYASNWLQGFIEPVLNNSALNAVRTLIHIVYDEDETAYNLYYSTNPPGQLANCTDLVNNCPGDANNNRVYSLLLGSAVSCQVNSTDNTLFDHNSIVSTIEDNWGLSPMTPYQSWPLFPLKDCSTPYKCVPKY
ncbi:phosphoesterase family-domain-containing protein [Polychytrium aggregatum]|uniref:phosphoesterase family-domain-containing protein n=1 Tax=Polychytrium aggregatum TaxID=110093 RepID=UPI0022FE7621|nr:phosphoesterase family-domain-containing protein [Polychytrium aggregatum]KAI9208373.1 phosphoesterase family-domain-containing protein [Polychytrium aggregatum]